MKTLGAALSVTPGRWAGGLLPCASGRLRDSHQPAGRASSKARPPLRPGAGLLWPRSRRYQVVWGSPMAGSAPPVTFITEPVIATRSVRLLADRLILPVRGRTHGIDLGIGNRLAVDPHLVALPSLRLGHHLGDQIPTQPHLPKLPPTGSSATLWPSWRLVHERPAHPLAHRQPVLPGGFNRLVADGGRQLIDAYQHPPHWGLAYLTRPRSPPPGGPTPTCYKPERPDPSTLTGSTSLTHLNTMEQGMREATQPGCAARPISAPSPEAGEGSGTMEMPRS
jgi:hypothetical protein